MRDAEGREAQGPEFASKQDRGCNGVAAKFRSIFRAMEETGAKETQRSG
jgi:hypothetical protein